MSEKFDAIVVGAGPAGSAASLSLAKMGFKVLLIERGRFPGSKNMVGGRLYAHSIKKIIPDFPSDAPIERRVTREVIGFMSDHSVLNIDFYNYNVPKEAESFTLLRARFDRWFASKAEEAGAFLVTGIKVDDLIIKDGNVRGVIAGPDKIECDVVIAADGANSSLAERAGLRSSYNAIDFSLGVKEIVELPKEKIEERFGLEGDEGVAMVHVGPFTKGVVGGSFLYTNKDSISLGVVVRLHSMMQKVTEGVDIYSHELVNSFLSHPYVKRLVGGGKVVEYSAHAIPEMPWEHRPKLYTNGMMVVGDAAGFIINTGYNLRGMDLAIQSGILAAEAYKKARDVGQFKAEQLAEYERLLKDSFVIKDLNRYKKAWKALDNQRLYTSYPEIILELVERLYTVDGKEKGKLVDELRRAMRGRISLFSAILDGLRMVRAV